MANISIATSIGATTGVVTVGGNKSINYDATSSLPIEVPTTVNNSTWTNISLDGLTEVYALWLYNDDTEYSSSVITVSTGSLGQNVLTQIPSGGTSLISWSGSLATLYGKITGGDDTTGTITMIATAS